MRAVRGKVTTAAMPVEVSSAPIAVVTLHVPEAMPAITVRSAVVRGRVTDEHAAPLPGVNVIFDSTSQTVTGKDGAFVLGNLPPGSETVLFRKVGFRAQDAAVVLSSQAPAAIDVTLHAGPPVLETVNVTASRENALKRVGFGSGAARARALS